MNILHRKEGFSLDDSDKPLYKKIVNQSIAFAVFIFLSYAVVVNWQLHLDKKDDFKTEPATAVIIDKTAQKLLYDGVLYYAILEENLVSQSLLILKAGQRASLTKKQFDTLEIGDSIDGFKIDNKFYVEQDIQNEFKDDWFTLFFIGIYPVGYILYILTRFKGINKIINQMPVLLDWLLGVAGLLIIFGGTLFLILFSFYEMSGSIKNVYDRTFSNDLVETNAYITHFDPGTGPRDRRYYLALSFNTLDGERIQLTKEVTSNTYHQAEKQIPIMYKPDQPYHVFMQELGFKDFVDILISNTVWGYFLTFVIVALLLYTLFLLNRKRRTGSYW